MTDPHYLAHRAEIHPAENGLILLVYFHNTVLTFIGTDIAVLSAILQTVQFETERPLLDQPGKQEIPTTTPSHPVQEREYAERPEPRRPVRPPNLQLETGQEGRPERG